MWPEEFGYPYLKFQKESFWIKTRKKKKKPIVGSEALEEEVQCWPNSVFLSKEKHNSNVGKWEEDTRGCNGIEGLWTNSLVHLSLSPQTGCEPHVVKNSPSPAARMGRGSEKMFAGLMISKKQRTKENMVSGF